MTTRRERAGTLFGVCAVSSALGASLGCGRVLGLEDTPSVADVADTGAMDTGSREDSGVATLDAMPGADTSVVAVDAGPPEDAGLDTGMVHPLPDGSPIDSALDTNPMDVAAPGEIIAQNQNDPLYITVDNKAAYWTRPMEGIVEVYDKGTNQLTAVPVAGTSPEPYGITTGPAGVFFADRQNGVIWGCGVSCAAPATQVASGLMQPAWVAVVPTTGYVVWTTGDGTIGSSRPSWEPIQGEIGAFAVAADTFGGVEWTDAPPAVGGSVKQAYQASDGGLTEYTTASNDANPTSISVDSSGLMYWTNQGDGTIRAAGTPSEVDPAGTILASGQSAPTTIVVDPVTAKLYWTNNGTGTGTSTGSVMRCDPWIGRTFLSVDAAADVLTGCVALANGQAGPYGIALDDTYVYWTDQGDGTVRRSAK